MVTGVIEVMVDEIPAEVYCRDNKDNPTPTKGPNMDPIVIPKSAFLSLNPFFMSSNFFEYSIKSVKPINPAIMRI